MNASKIVIGQALSKSVETFRYGTTRSYRYTFYSDGTASRAMVVTNEFGRDMYGIEKEFGNMVYDPEQFQPMVYAKTQE